MDWAGPADRAGSPLERARGVFVRERRSLGNRRAVEAYARGVRTPSGGKLDAAKVTALVVALALGIVFWDSPVLWPLKLLVVMMQESGHALATLLVGGSVHHVTIDAQEAGACVSRLPSGAFPKIAVYSAGYLGSAVAGAAM